MHVSPELLRPPAKSRQHPARLAAEGLARIVGVSGRQGMVTALVHAGVAALAIVCATVLAAFDKLDPQAVVALFGAAIGLAGGVGAAVSNLAGNGRGGNGRNRRPPAAGGRRQV